MSPMCKSFRLFGLLCGHYKVKKSLESIRGFVKAVCELEDGELKVLVNKVRWHAVWLLKK